MREHHAIVRLSFIENANDEEQWKIALSSEMTQAMETAGESSSRSTDPSPTRRRKRLILLGLIVAAVVGAIVAVVLVLTLDTDDSSSSRASSQQDTENNNNPTLTPITGEPTSAFPTSSPTVPPSTTSDPTTSAPTTEAPTALLTAEPSTSPRSKELQLGLTNGVEYFHCNTPPRENDKQLVLLHGASFNKQTWRNEGILDDFCDASATVAALDFSVGSNHMDLIGILDALESERIISQPITLVTPSASGFTIVDWIIRGNVALLPNHVDTWVPVATGSLVRATDEQVASLAFIRILAIYGNEDGPGGRYSERLGRLANATVVELMGRHAVYRQSPQEFANTILNF